MEQLDAFPEEPWQEVVCHICKHRFAIAAEDAQSASKILCQTCTLLVEWFGQDDALPAPTPAASAPARAPAPPKPARQPPRKERQRAQLGSLLERWGDLWRGSEEQE